MNILDAFSNWINRKAYSYALNSLKNVPRDNSHHEKYKARDALQANIDAQNLKVNNDLVSSYSESLQSGVVGTGFTLQFKSKDPVLNEDVESFLSYWSEYENCEITGGYFREDLERFLVSEASVVGGFIVRDHWDKRFPALYKTEVLSIDVIDRNKDDFAKGLYRGLQTNKNGEVKGIWIYNDAQRFSSKLVSMKNLTLYVDRWVSSHQYTNVTPLAPVLNTLDNLATYTKAEIKGAEKRANKSVIIATEAYSIMLEAQKAFMSQKIEGSAERSMAEQEYQELLGEFSASGLHDGAIPILGGDDTQVWDLKQGGDTIYADISLNSKQVFSKGLGLSPSTIAGIPESSYNVALKNAQSDEVKFAIVGQKVIEKVLKRVYRNAVEAGHLLGFYNLDGYYDDKKKIKYHSYLKITRKERGHIDVLKQNIGDATSVKSGFSSKMSVISSKGKDYLDVINDEVTYELARKKAFEDNGLTYIQTGLEDIELAEAKEEAKNNNKDGDE